MEQVSLLKFVTCGSVDDGKSTLIGRLLYETKSILEDQYDSICKTSQKRGLSEVDLSLLLDGLAAEREQAITIDVAHRYFSTPKRKFIIADTPGHEQYTRNMITGASTSDCAILLIDARKGVLTQSKRHGFLVSLLGIPHVVVIVNKMDLVNYSEAAFRQVIADFSEFSAKLQFHDIQFIPVSALKGDNVVSKSVHMSWYEGPTLLHYLENVHTGSDKNLVDFRFPVQNVIRPHLDFRGYAGRVISGTISRGEEITILPSGKKTRLKAITTYDGELTECSAGMSVVLVVEDQIDISRGDMIVRRNNQPCISQTFDVIMCWLSEQEMHLEYPYILKHTTRNVKAWIQELAYKIDVNTLHRQKTSFLQLNEIGRASIRVSQPLCVDPYQLNRGTGSFILIDPVSNSTVAAGMIRNAVSVVQHKEPDQLASPDTVWAGWTLSRDQHEQQNGHEAAVIWLTGLSGSGKTTIGKMLEKRLYDSHFHTMLLDGDNLRHGLCRDLGFSEQDRGENVRRISEVARLFFNAGTVVICTCISPLRMHREMIREFIENENGHFFEIYVKCSIEECARRDPKGLYKRASLGEIKEFTGISSAYEEPMNPELTIDTENGTPQEHVEKVIGLMRASGIRFPGVPG